MTLRALDSRVLPVQVEAGFRVIKRLRIPANDLEILAVVLRVAPYTIFPGSCRR